MPGFMMREREAGTRKATSASREQSACPGQRGAETGGREGREHEKNGS